MRQKKINNKNKKKLFWQMIKRNFKIMRGQRSFKMIYYLNVYILCVSLKVILYMFC